MQTAPMALGGRALTQARLQQPVCGSRCDSDTAAHQTAWHVLRVAPHRCHPLQGPALADASLLPLHQGDMPEVWLRHLQRSKRSSDTGHSSCLALHSPDHKRSWSQHATEQSIPTLRSKGHLLCQLQVVGWRLQAGLSPGRNAILFDLQRLSWRFHTVRRHRVYSKLLLLSVGFLGSVVQTDVSAWLSCRIVQTRESGQLPTGQQINSSGSQLMQYMGT